MKSWGLTLLIFGLGSCVLHMMGSEFMVFSWINTWGEEVGWGIRIAMAMVGMIMLGAGLSQARKP